MASRATPGGPGLSDAKRRRLAALETTLAATAYKQKDKRTVERGAPATTQQPRKRQKKGGAASPAAAAATPPREQEEAAAPLVPPYDPLCSSIRESILSKTPNQGGARVQGNVVRELLEQLMLTNPKTSSVRAALGLKVQDKNILLDNPAAPVKPPPRTHHTLTNRLLSGAKRKQLGLDRLRPEHMKYKLMVPLHELWQRYVRDVLRTGQGILEQQLLQLDLHGCLLTVVRHRDSRLVGLQGIVVKYSAAVFHMVSQADRLVQVPRLRDTEVQFRVDAKRVVLLRT